MARLFDDGASEYLESSATPISATPVTLGAWVYTDDVNQDDQTAITIQDTASGANFLSLTTRIGGPGLAVRAYSKQGEDSAYSSVGLTQDTWHHICAVFAATNSRIAYLDGGNSGSNAGVSTDTGFDTVAIGARRDSSPGEYWSGRIAEAAIWNVALTVNEVGILALGYSPLFVRPQSLVSYWSLIRDEDQDRVGGYDMAAYNTPGIAPHAPVYYPVSPHI